MSSPHAGVPTCYRHPGRETYIACQRCARPICPDCMRDAAVGFQCPECVAEGSRQTRSAQTPYGGNRSSNPALTSYVLIAINALVWLAIMATGAAKSKLVHVLALTPDGRCDSIGNPSSYYPQVHSQGICESSVDGIWRHGVDDGAFWQLLTSAFTHVEVWHIGFNMLALYFLGPQLELVLGRWRFLALYLGSALTGSVLVYALTDPTSYTLGASGAIFGLMGALVILVLKVGGNVQSLFLWLGLNAVITFAVPGISWQGHVGGFVGGVLLAGIFFYAPRQRRTPLQVAGLVAVLLVTLAVVAVRTLALA